MKRRAYLITALLMGTLLVLAQGCMRFRTSDQDAVADFAKGGLTLVPHRLAAGNRTMHYVAIGAPHLPTLVFIHGSPGSWNAFSTYLKDSLLT